MRRCWPSVWAPRRAFFGASPSAIQQTDCHTQVHNSSRRPHRARPRSCPRAARVVASPPQPPWSRLPGFAGARVRPERDAAARTRAHARVPPPAGLGSKVECWRRCACGRAFGRGDPSSHATAHPSRGALARAGKARRRYRGGAVRAHRPSVSMASCMLEARDCAPRRHHQTMMSRLAVPAPRSAASLPSAASLQVRRGWLQCPIPCVCVGQTARTEDPERKEQF